MGLQQAIIEMQRCIYEEGGTRTHAHYKEGYGVLVVREGDPLAPQYVIASMDEASIRRIAAIRRG